MRFKAYVETRENKKGISYRARFRSYHGTIKVFDISKTFQSYSKADGWLEMLTEYQGDPAAMGTLINSSMLLRDMLTKLEDTLRGSIARTDRSCINVLKGCCIANTQVRLLTPNHIHNLANELGSERIVCKINKRTNTHDKKTREPATVHWYISRLSSFLKQAKTVLGIKIDNQCVIDAWDALKTQKLVDQSETRTVVLTPEDEVIVDQACKAYEQKPNVKFPYSKIFRFLLAQAPRSGQLPYMKPENTQYSESKMAIIRDRNSPDNKNPTPDRTLTPAAAQILKTMPQDGDYFFSYNMNSVAAGFRKIFDSVGLEHVQVRDLRRTAITRLNDAGLSTEMIRTISGHSAKSRVLEERYIVPNTQNVAKKLEEIEPLIYC